MDTHKYETLFAIEENHWWFVGQRVLLRFFLNKYYRNRSDLKLLDVGCGTGKNVSVLSEYGAAQGSDIANDAVVYCKKRGLNITQSDVMDLKFQDRSFDVITSLGVFYHKGITDDVKAMKEVHRILKQGGRFFIFDCAMMSLYGKHDLAFQGIRRYSKKELKRKLEKAGFIVERISYVNSILFPPIFLYRKLSNLISSTHVSDVDAPMSPLINWLLKNVYRTELRLNKYFDYPFGVNIYAIARK